MACLAWWTLSLMLLSVPPGQGCDEKACNYGTAAGAAVGTTVAAVAGAFCAFTFGFGCAVAGVAGASVAAGLSAGRTLCGECGNGGQQDSQLKDAQQKMNQMLNDQNTSLDKISKEQLHSRLKQQNWFNSLSATQKDLLTGQARISNAIDNMDQVLKEHKNAQQKMNQMLKDQNTSLEKISKEQLHSMLLQQNWFNSLSATQKDLLTGQERISNALYNIGKEQLKSRLINEIWFKSLSVGQQDLLLGQATLKLNQATILKELSKSFSKLKELGTGIQKAQIISLYGEDITNLLNIMDLFQVIEKDDLGQIISNYRSREFLDYANNFRHGLKTSSKNLVRMLTSGHVLKTESLWSADKTFCTDDYKAYFLRMLAASFTLRTISLAMEGNQIDRLEADRTIKDMFKINEQYAKDCGCSNSLGQKIETARHDLSKLTEFMTKTTMSCGDSMASTCSTCPGGEESCGGDCAWHGGVCRVSGIFEAAVAWSVTDIESAPVRNKLKALFKLRSYSLTPEVISLAESTPWETIRLAEQLERAYGGRNVFSEYDGTQYCSSILILPDILYLSDKTLVSLPSSRPVQGCSVPELPIKQLFGAVSGSIDNDLLICGGYDDGVISTCHRLNNGKWLQHHTMTSKRYFAAASQTSRGLFISGGSDGKKRLSTTEVLTSAGWVAGPSLPVGVNTHCQVTVETRDTVIVTGGDNDSGGTSAVYALTGQTWTPLQPMKYPRYGHSCTLVNNKILIVMGGYGRQDVEMYDVSTDTWTTGPSLPSDMSYGQAVSFNTQVNHHTQVIAVYSDGKVLQLSDDWKNWINLDNIAEWSVSGYRPFFPAPLVNRKILGC